MEGSSSEQGQASFRQFPPCRDISSQAYDFITQSNGVEWQFADFSPTGVAELRAANSAVGARAWDKIKKECPVMLKDGTIGGVSCQWVSPPNIIGSETILYMFGGAFVVGSPEDDLCMTARIACCMGRRVCVPRYRLAPEHPFPAARDDVTNVYRALSRNCGVFVIGESAGGNLALSVVLSARHSNAPPPLAVALLSPWIDLSHTGDSHAVLLGLDPTLSIQHFLEPAARAYAGKRSISDPEISPLFATIPSDLPPTLISTATRDLLMSDSVRIAQKLRKSCSVDLRVQDGLWHVFEWYPDLPEATASLEDIVKFFLSYVRPQANQQLRKVTLSLVVTLLGCLVYWIAVGF